VEVENLRAMRRAKPFRPFTIHATSGESYLVAHPELIIFVPDESVAIIASAPSNVSLVDVASISDVSYQLNANPPVGPDDRDEAQA